jgi:ABC-type Fe3+-hydroxamate transport system substrate-binding protein
LAAQHESEAGNAKKQLAKAEKQIEKLKSQLETERKKAKSANGVRAPSVYFIFTIY